ncbi:MAG: aldolase/citrate lyase family protein [Rikenellaceae bacterium]
MTKNFIKEKIASGEAVLGPFLKMNDPALVEIAALAGFDFCIIDMEHGPLNLESAQNLIRAAELHGMSPIIRTTDASHESILRALDIGAHGVEVPQVNSKESAKSVVDGAKFFPEGTRGVCRYTRAAEYTNIDKAAHFAGSNANTMVIVHIEGLEGINNLEDILEVKGLDIIFLGPYDLSQSCGVPGEVTNPIVVEKMKQAISMAAQKNVKVGTFVESAEGAKFWRELGVSYLAYSVDVGIYYNACKAIVEEVNS